MLCIRGQEATETIIESLGHGLQQFTCFSPPVQSATEENFYTEFNQKLFPGRPSAGDPVSSSSTDVSEDLQGMAP